MPDAQSARARSCIHGIFAVAFIWCLTMIAAVAAAQDVSPQRWNTAAAEQLLEYIDTIGSHGLDPANYAPDALREAIGSDSANLLEHQATQSFGLLARDLATGHLPPGQRGRYFILSDSMSPSRVALLIDAALAGGEIGAVLEGLAPQHPDYAALRKALSALPASRRHEREMIAASLERWRWLPRGLGQRYIMVNIPEYRLRLMEGNSETAAHRVIVGKVQTPTPQFSAAVNAITFGPSWHVPQSIVAESVGRLVRSNPDAARARGYVWSFDSRGRLQVTQMPGPANALGQVRFDMPNPFSVFVHDTPNKELFDRAERTLSHGCIRTEHPLDLAAMLLDGPEWSQQAIQDVISQSRTMRVPLDRPVPIYIVYMTAAVQRDGTVRYLDDPYSLDQSIIAGLGDSTPTTLSVALDFEAECALSG